MIQTHMMLLYYAFVQISFEFLYLWLVVAYVQYLSQGGMWPKVTPIMTSTMWFLQDSDWLFGQPLKGEIHLLLNEIFYYLGDLVKEGN